MQLNTSQAPTSIESIATEWFVKLNSDALDAAEKQALKTWLQSSDTHRRAFEKVARAWQDAGYCDSLALSTPTLEKIDKKKNVGFIYTLMSAAAMLLISFFVFVNFTGIEVADKTYAITSTFDGNRSERLSDGSVVTLSGNSQIEVTFTAKERQINLVRGTAHFEVSSDKTRPFTVYSKGVYTRAIGTAFQVKMDGGLKISVTEGTVMVGDTQTNNRPQVTVTGGNEVNVELVNRQISAVVPFDEQTTLSWMNGRLIYNDVLLSDIVDDLNRYREKQLYIGSRIANDIRIDASFEVNRADTFIRGLAFTHDIYSQETADRTILIYQPDGK